MYIVVRPDDIIILYLKCSLYPRGVVLGTTVRVERVFVILGPGQGILLARWKSARMRRRVQRTETLKLFYRVGYVYTSR